jgi:membrane protein DedA with SNARE-associated domain
MGHAVDMFILLGVIIGAIPAYYIGKLVGKKNEMSRKP